MQGKAGKIRLPLKLLGETHRECNHFLELTHLISVHLAGVWRVERSKERKTLACLSCVNVLSKLQQIALRCRIKRVQERVAARGRRQPGAALFPHPTRGWVQFGQSEALAGWTLPGLARRTMGVRALIYHLTRVAGLPELAVGTSENI